MLNGRHRNVMAFHIATKLVTYQHWQVVVSVNERRLLEDRPRLFQVGVGVQIGVG
jgi:hypothetical protein